MVSPSLSFFCAEFSLGVDGCRATAVTAGTNAQGTCPCVGFAVAGTEATE